MSNDWAELKRLFHGALEQPPDRREAWLAAATANHDLVQRVRALVRAHDTAGDFLEQPPELEPPDHIGPYQILRELGRGGMGIVYLAHDTRLNRPVALKSLPPAAATDPALRERLRREALAAATITHPGVAVVYSLEEFEGDLFIASEYVNGTTLRDLIAKGALPLERARRIAMQIAAALVAAHDAGVAHRDLKPENIIIGDADAAKLVDFGIAQVADLGLPPLTRAGAAMGTPAYMAPEQVAGLGVDSRSDIYAAGVIFGEMLTGVHPLSPSAEAMPEPAAAIVRRCLASEPRSRFQTARELLSELEHIGRPSRRVPYYWWAFHQAAAVVVYGALIVPLWSARQLIGGPIGRTVFLAGLGAAIIASALRLHRWFTSSWYPSEFSRVRQRSEWSLRAADIVYAGAIFAGGIAASGTDDALAILLISFCVGIVVAFLAIEPATARAAFQAASRTNQ